MGNNPSRPKEQLVLALVLVFVASLVSHVGEPSITGFALIPQSFPTAGQVMVEGTESIKESQVQQAIAPGDTRRDQLMILRAKDRQAFEESLVPPEILAAGAPLQVKKWGKLELDFDGGGNYWEKGNGPNPFTDIVLTVTFTGPSNQQYVVPGFFDGDGQGDGTGNVYRVRFSPDEVGMWNYVVSSFTKFGSPLPEQGTTGTFDVLPLDGSEEGFFKWGRLEYIGEHYLKFRDGPYWIKGGTDSPENFIGYKGFDDTTISSGTLHQYPTHVNDWVAGDPNFVGNQGTDAKGIIGALNYLNSVGINSVYFLPMNIGGDAKDTWPFAQTVGEGLDRRGSPSNDNMHYDISKLTQWDIVFDHAQRKNVHLYFILCEAEEDNKRELDNAGFVGPERSLFYRELIARFGYLPAVSWNLCEEYDLDLDLGPAIVKNWADYLYNLDPYKHPISVHNTDGSATWGDNALEAWQDDGFFGHTSLTIASIQDWDGAGEMQSNPRTGAVFEAFRTQSMAAGHPVVAWFDEPDSVSSSASGQESRRKDVLWPSYLSGAGGMEWYIGSNDQDVEDFRNYGNIYRWTTYARTFLQDNTEFWLMEPMDFLSPDSSAQVLANPGVQYAIYFPSGPANNQMQLDFQGFTDDYEVLSFNPVTGQFNPTMYPLTVSSPGMTQFIVPPVSSPDSAVLITAAGVGVGVCFSDSECVAPLICRTDNTCGVCTSDSDCDNPSDTCVDGVCQLVPNCDNNGDCNYPDKICLNQPGGTCQDCTIDSQCSGGHVCLVNQDCGLCTSDADCDNPGDVCWLDGTCQPPGCGDGDIDVGAGEQCEFDTQCPGAESCAPSGDLQECTCGYPRQQCADLVEFGTFCYNDVTYCPRPTDCTLKNTEVCIPESVDPQVVFADYACDYGASSGSSFFKRCKNSGQPGQPTDDQCHSPVRIGSVTYICAFDASGVLGWQPRPQVEVCGDGYDNNCDNRIDEGCCGNRPCAQKEHNL